MAQLAIVADDLTGAADTGACFADAGYSAVIPLVEGLFPAADVLVLSTESRDLTAGAAAELVGKTVAKIRSNQDESRPRWIYKKIDSALRGHPRDELLAAMETLGTNRAIVALALPAEGRTTIGGRQYVDGVPLESSSFSGSGAPESLRDVFANDRDLPVHLLDLETLRFRSDAVQNLLQRDAPGIIVADAETDDDLAILSRAVASSGGLILCGAAGFARQLAPMLPLTASAVVPVKLRQSDRPILVVAGSRHAATARQIAALGQTGSPIVRLEQAHLDDPTCSIDATVADIAAALASGHATVLTTAGLSPSTSRARSVAARLAEIATSPQVRSLIGGLMLTGGDIAAAVCANLGATALWLGGEIYAGQPWGTLDGGAMPGLPVATKAGSFGRDDAMLMSVDHLQRLQWSHGM